jgi:preprotein translocase subunit SecY
MAEEEEKKGKFSIEKIAKYLPSVEKPTYKQPFNKRMIWTGIALIAYIVMSHVSIYGIGTTPQLDALLLFQTLLGAKFGSLMTLGIGPIVTAGILLQLLVGSKIINWEMSDPESRAKFQTWNKLLSIILCFGEGLAYVLAGAIPVTGGVFVIAFVVLQLAAGGVIVILLDEVVSKWGFGSGISLFIATGVATQIAIGLFSPFVAPNGKYVGNVIGFIFSILNSNNLVALSYLTPIITTVVVSLIVVYAQNIRIDIPLVFSAMRGFGRTWSLKLFYTSNIPVILAAALIANFQLMGRIGLDPATSCGFLACYDSQGSITSGILYYLTSPRNLLGDAVAGTLVHSEMIRAATYLTFLSLAAMLFSVFWVSTSGMSSASVAEQIENIGMHIPGYRSDKKTMEGVLQRYIPSLAVLGGLAVGALAAFADFTGAIGTGTGILLTVMIVYNYYEELSAQPLEDAHPWIKKVLGE